MYISVCVLYTLNNSSVETIKLILIISFRFSYSQKDSEIKNKIIYKQLKFKKICKIEEVTNGNYFKLNVMMLPYFSNHKTY